ncbi:hypothetical protein LRR80_04067 [Streptomyces sp. RO-S4]|uniref:hypothetical protein n=1 Tax=unclassified Streptomyces TaxID=2593676 RepID=UPI001E33259C|nr:MULTISPECIES: hypothetical protein [unclassified Streptomyces]MCO4697998.1 hypothetical protein [Streptomyces sp. RO-S4]
MAEEGGRLAEEWANSDYSVCGILHGHRDGHSMAERLGCLGWRSRSSSWHGYEVGTDWCEFELEPDDQDVLLNGVVAPHRFDDLTALLTRFGVTYTLELYDENGNLVRETHG